MALVDVSVWCPSEHRLKRLAVQVDESAVIARLEVEVGETQQAFVDEHPDVVRATGGRYGAELAVGKEDPEFVLARELEVAMEQLFDWAEAHATRGGEKGEHIAALVLEHFRVVRLPRERSH